MPDTQFAPAPLAPLRSRPVITEIEPGSDARLDAAPPNPGNCEPFAHVVVQEELVKAIMNGTLVRAVCGKLFSPKVFCPDGIPVCPICKALLEHWA
jgi:hypothetical protein